MIVMKERLSVMAIGAMAAAACSEVPPGYDSPDAIVAEAKASVSRRMKDPASAQFRKVRMRGRFTVCGEVNGRNSFGAFAGFEPFVYVDASFAPPELDRDETGAHLLSAPRPKVFNRGGGYELVDPLPLIERYCR